MSARRILEANPEAAHWYVRLRERFDPITRPDWHVDLDRLVEALSTESALQRTTPGCTNEGCPGLRASGECPQGYGVTCCAVLRPPTPEGGAEQ